MGTSSLPPFMRRHTHRFRIVYVFILIAGLICQSNSTDASATKDTAQRESGTSSQTCLTEADLDFETCHLEQLPKQALIDICERLGLDVPLYVFPLLDEFDGFHNDGAGDGKEDGTNQGSEESATEAERSHDDYVRAAYECLRLEFEIDELEEKDPHKLELLEESMLAEDPLFLSNVFKEILERNPEFLADLEEELKATDPDLYRDLVEELAEDDGHIGHYPELVADLVTLILAETPDLLSTLDEDLADHIRERIKADHHSSDEHEEL